MTREREIALFESTVGAIKQEVGKVIVGQDDVIEEVIICLFAGGHALLEGAPGLGKTLLVRALAEVSDLRFARIQFTPDLMPSDITGTRIVVNDAAGHKRFELSRGPIFGQLVLADEINRATPKTQSALLEAMAEGSVTLAGERHALEAPFCVLATENPIEMEGTYPLPEAQLDRFLLKILVPNPSEEDLVRILERTTTRDEPRPAMVLGSAEVLAHRMLVREVNVSESLLQYVARLVRATDPALTGNEAARRHIRHGAGVRAAQALVLGAKVHALMRGRGHVGYEDLERLVQPVLRHRIILRFEAEADGLSPDRIIEEVLGEVQQGSDDARLIEGRA